MIHRVLYQSQIKCGEENRLRTYIAENQNSLIEMLRKEGYGTFSLYGYQTFLFLYAETVNSDSRFEWPEAYTIYLDAWPGEATPRYAIPMNDIYHDNKPDVDYIWRPDGYEPHKRVGSLAKLKPDMYSSYVYYHYQMQEEQMGRFNKYYMIGSQGRYIFSYHEEPAVIEPAPMGKLSTSLSPQNRWMEVMTPHFEFWEDGDMNERIWRKLSLWLSF